jgi:hypothetical protein
MRTEKSKIKHLPALQHIKIPIQLDLWGYEAIWVQEAIYWNRTSRNIYEDGPDKC